MESRKSNGVFELTERRLNAPAGSIEVLESRRRELGGIKVCKDGFKGGVGDRETDNAFRGCKGRKSKVVELEI